MAKHKREETLIKKERHWIKHWNPEMAMVTFIGVLVIVGSMAISGMAINDLKNALNDANARLGSISSPPLYTVQANASACVFTCAVNSQLSIPIEPVSGATSCAAAGKVSILAFHSPTCPYCDAQEPMFNQLKQKYGEQLDLQYVCTEIHSGDDQLCKENKDGKYLAYDAGRAMLTKYAQSVQGTPTLIFNCEYARVGSYALRDQTAKTTVEYDDLEKIVSTLLAS